MITVAQLRQVLHELDAEVDAEIIVEFPGGLVPPRRRALGSVGRGS